MPAPVIVAITDEYAHTAAVYLITKLGLADQLNDDQRDELDADLREALLSAAVATGQTPAPQPELFGSTP